MFIWHVASFIFITPVLGVLDNMHKGGISHKNSLYLNKLNSRWRFKHRRAQTTHTSARTSHVFIMKLRQWVKVGTDEIPPGQSRQTGTKQELWTHKTKPKRNINLTIRRWGSALMASFTCKWAFSVFTAVELEESKKVFLRFLSQIWFKFASMNKVKQANKQGTSSAVEG